MTSLLSIILSVLLAFAGTGEVLAVPETATQYTLGNVTITYNDETVTLAPEAVLTLALGTDEAAASFAITDGEDTYMPMFAALTGEALTFAIGDGKAYTLDDAAIENLLGDTEELRSVLTQVLTVADAYALTEAEALENSDLMMDIMKEQITLTEESNEIEIGGTVCNTQVYEGTLTLTGLGEMIDGLCAESDVLNRMITAPLQNMAEQNGGEFTGWADLFAEISGEEDIELMSLRLETAENEGERYVDVGVSTSNDEDIYCGVEASWLGTMTDGVYELAVVAADEDACVSVGGTMNITDLYGDTCAADFDFSIVQSSGYTTGDNEDEIGDIVYSISTVGIDGSCSEIYGLSNLDMNITVDTEFGYETADEDNDGYNYSSTANVGIAYNETALESGAIEGRFAIDAESDGQKAGLSFILTCEEVPFDGAALTEGRETAAIATEEDFVQLLGDFAALGEDALKLAEEPTVQALMGLGSNAILEDFEGGYVEDEDYACADCEGCESEADCANCWIEDTEEYWDEDYDYEDFDFSEFFEDDFDYKAFEGEDFDFDAFFGEDFNFEEFFGEDGEAADVAGEAAEIPAENEDAAAAIAEEPAAEEEWFEIDEDMDAGYEHLPFAEAIEKFAGEKVSFTAPEGYAEAAEENDVFESEYICAYYVDEENDREIALTLVNGVPGTVCRYMTLGENGEATDISEPLIMFDGDEEGISCATVIVGDTYISLSFDPCTYEEAKAIAAGLIF